MSGTTEALHGEATVDLESLLRRSRMLGRDRAIVNYGGGNTSVKTRDTDHLGREIDVLWVKGSGSDLAGARVEDFCGLRLDEVVALRALSELSDDAMTAHLARCQLAPHFPRPSIETLLHAFVPHPHVDHTHPDAIGAIVGSQRGEELAAECFDGAAVWVPYLRPGFALSKLVADLLDAQPGARLVLLAKHGLVTWGETSDEAYESALWAISRARAFVDERRRLATPGHSPSAAPAGDDRDELLSALMPALRGAVSKGAPKILCLDSSERIRAFLSRSDAHALSQIGAACPDHLVHTKRKPLWVPFDPATDTGADLVERIPAEVARYCTAELAYFAAHDVGGADPNPRVVLVEGLGLVGIGPNAQAAALARDLYHRAIAVLEGAAALGGFVSLDDAEAVAVEFWPLELYKLGLRPPPKELEGRVALVTGGAGGIGAAIAHRLADGGAAVAVVDLDGSEAARVARGLSGPALSVTADVTSEADVARAFREAVARFGGVDIVVSNAGIASGAPVQETTLDMWSHNHDVLVAGYFLVAREAADVLRRQGLGGSIIFVASKNGIVAGANAAAYSSAKAAELHLARCLAEELGPYQIRVNSVNPDAVLKGSKIWSSSWREERAAAYGVDPEKLEEHYRARTTLKVDVLPEDVAEAVLFFASERCSGKSTGNMLNVDGGVPAAYPR